jgi:hypothetical protein
MRAYCMGNDIILAHVRFIAHGECNSRMYHSDVIIFNGHYQTLECDRMDVSGLCLGHKISRKEFLERYCGGMKPEAGGDLKFEDKQHSWKPVPFVG